MNGMKWTQTRHIVLRLVEPGTTVIYVRVNPRHGIWKYRLVNSSSIGGPEARALGELELAGLIGHRVFERFSARRPVSLTAKGQELLSVWNAEHGEPQS
ncbi:hypothetical protein [Kutzneria albida]|uniref:Uncharacterized protein n=1 Tax=Kutzneria albida DSM 43870 TaxID=1449976 RepID=W5WAT9_9PSEU|nr:hypothetical protein [Kutzneria albida]AHH98243.1 hypothetical protein KALB_4881 [Kutzneria albida DSM 43870]